MAKLPTNLTKQNVYELQEAAENFFPEELKKIKGVEGKSRWAIKDLNLSWNSKAVFEKYIERITETSSIVGAYDQLQRWAIEAPVSLGTDANTLTGEESKSKIAEMEKKEADRKKTIEESNRLVRQAIEKQKELHDKMVEQKVEKAYVEVKGPPTSTLNKNTQDFINNAKASPKEYVATLTDNIEKSIRPQLSSTLTKEQIHLMAENAAYKAVDAAVNPQKYLEEARQTAVLSAVAKDQEVIPSLIKNEEALGAVRVAATEMGTFKNLSTLNPRNIFSAFNPELANTLFPDPQSFQVSFSQQQLPGYDLTFNPTGLTQGYTNFLGSQGNLFNSLARLPIDQVQSELVGRASSWLEGRIAASFPELSAAFNAPEAQVFLQSLGIGGQLTINLPASMSTFFAENPAMMPALNFVGNSLGIDFSIGSAAATAGGEAAVLAGGETAVVAGGAGVEIAAGAAAAPVTGGLSLAVAAVAAVVGPKVVKLVKDNIHKVSGFIVGIAGGILGGGIAAATGTSIFFGGLLGFGGGFGIHALASGGMPALGASLSGAASAGAEAVGIIWATFLAGVGTPILAFLIGFPVIVALILFIINSGAYVVPPGQQFLNETNPYISVEKTANPNGQLPSPTSISYEVTITAKKDTLTGITISPECQATKKGSTLECPKEDIPAPPDSINAGTPFSFSYTVNYGSQYQDSLVSNSIVVTAVSSQGGQQTETGSASVCFGDCPLDCFDVNDSSWKQVSNLQSNVTAAASTIASKYPDFAAKVCSAGTVKLCYTTSNPAPGSCEDTYAIHFHSSCDISFNKCGIQSSSDALFLLTHEATHHIQNFSGQYERLFKQQVPESEWSLCTYSRTAGDSSESMAEGDALYVGKPSWNGCVTNYINQYSKHYQFAKNVMFAP